MIVWCVNIFFGSMSKVASETESIGMWIIKNYAKYYLVVDFNLKQTRRNKSEAVRLATVKF